MKKHIVRVIAIVTATLMLLSIIPAAALQELSLPNLMSAVTGSSEIGSADASVKDSTAQNTKEEENVQGDAIVDNDDYDFAADVTLGKDYSAPSMMATGPDMATGPADADGIEDVSGMISKSFSSYEPFYTDHEYHPFLTHGSAWMDLSKIYYGAPATQNFPITDWSANTSVYNITGTGKYWESGKATDTEKFVFPDKDLIDGYIWADYRKDERLPIMETHADGTPVKDSNNKIKYYEQFEPGVVDTSVTYEGVPYVVSKNDEEAYAYNRYDAMQGKYGITLDRNVQSAMWVPKYVMDYYGTDDYYGSVVHLSDTPYLYFSTEAPDSKKIAISLLIGAPVQNEVLSGDKTASTHTAKYEYRWYTITDSSDRPGVDASTRDLSMTPIVTVSDVVATVTGLSNGTTAYNQQNKDVFAEVAKFENGDDPLALAAADGIDTSTLFTKGAVTGCIDFTNILPTVMGNYALETDHGAGREAVQYKISQIRVDTEDAEGTSSAARINYLYFGPSLVTTFIPQSTAGAEFNGQAWQHAQLTAGTVGNETTDYGASVRETAGTERAYTSGWENGAAVTITNTPNDPQFMTIDIHGDGKGELIEWDQLPPDAKVIHGSQDDDRPSKVWKFTDKKGVTHYMEAECADEDDHSDGQYYVMVTVPVRKWINVLGEARKLYFNATLLHAGIDGRRPGFGLWGNEAGSLGPGHGGTGMGSRFRNEDILIMFGDRMVPYHIDEGQPYHIALVDSTTGDSLIYNKEGETYESWFDFLRSPYVFNQTVRGANETCKTTDDHIGYCFVTTLRFAMPIGSAITIQNMRGDGNSAGLNSYSTSGHIVSAYDGGSGSQPEINMDNTLPEKQFTFANGTFSEADLDTENGIKGTISTDPAAYGPMLKESYYTIYDMLDTEMLYSTGNASQAISNPGKDKQPIYGENWLNDGGHYKDSYGNRLSTFNKDLPIYDKPTSDGSTLLGIVGENCQFVVYATAIRPDKDKYALTGVLKKDGTSTVGWVKVYDFSDDKACATRISGVPLYANQSVSIDGAKDFANQVVSELSNKWVISNFGAIDEGATFYEKTGSSFYFNSSWRSTAKNTELNNQAFDEGHTLVSQYRNGPQLKYANMWMSNRGHYSCGYSTQDFHLRSVNGTDMEWGFKRKVNTSNNMSLGMTRAFKEPIRLLRLGPRGSYPVLYLDYTSNGAFKIGINLRIDGKDRTWYVDHDQDFVHHDSDVSSGNHYAYLSFENIMSGDYMYNKEFYVTGISLYMWKSTSVSEANAVLRRCEIWQEETDWLDQIVADNQDASGKLAYCSDSKLKEMYAELSDAEKKKITEEQYITNYKSNMQSKYMNAKVTDSMNVINDAFFNVHDETSDGAITVTHKGSYASGTNIGVNNANKGDEFTYTDGTKSTAMDYWKNYEHYKYTRTDSYRKNNSNKGWSAFIRLDANGDDKLTSADKTYYSRDGVEGYDTQGNKAYEYRSALGHLRVWMPAGAWGQVVFESDRSFNTKNYRYLYYSYSMRDVDTGISAEDSDDSSKPGISMAIKSDQLGSDQAYSEILVGNQRTWAYYPEGSAYWDGEKQDNRLFRTTINAAVDLSSFDGIESVNQFVFYLNNPSNKQAEFYINYIHLSNTPPSDLIKSQIEEPQYQYYYLMDNTGDRYSARFPTIDNPTGAVSGLNCDNDRVNPVKVRRGGRLSDGTYFNGDPLYTYGKHDGDRVYNESSGSPGYYEKTYGSTDNQTGSMQHIMFYTGGTSYKENNKDTDVTDIKDYYTYKRKDPATGTYVEGTVQDMKWSYGRWYVESEVNTDSAVNTMYVPENGQGVEGNLTRRYATENAVLLRGGIMPIKYLTYYDAQGGQMKYDTSSDEIKNGVIQNDNNYYITETTIFSYFQMPHITNYVETNKPTKYGFRFDGWLWDETAANGNISTSTIYSYTRKTAPGLNYFYADWQVADGFDEVTHTVTFMDPNRGGKNVWYTREANIGNEFQMLMPDMLRATVNGKSVHVRGWKIQGADDGIVYTPGSSVTITDDVTFEAVTENIVDGYDNSAYTHSVTVSPNATLKLLRDLNNPTDLGDPAALGIKKVKNTYYNIPHGTVVVLVPNSFGATYGWTMDLDAAGVADGGADTSTQAVCGTDYKRYQFSVLSDVSISYAQVNSLLDLDSGSPVQSSVSIFTTAAETTVNTINMYGREMKFYTQFDLSKISGAELVCYGTLYTKSGANYDSIKAKLNENMRLDESTINANTVKNGAFGTLTSAVRQVKATRVTDNKGNVIEEAANSSNQYYLMVTENKGNAVTYYARGYVIYKLDGQYKVAYSDTVARSEVEAASNLTDDVA